MVCTNSTGETSVNGNALEIQLLTWAIFQKNEAVRLSHDQCWMHYLAADLAPWAFHMLIRSVFIKKLLNSV